MELLQILQLSFLLGIFLLNLLFVVLPLKLVPHEQQHQGNTRSTSSRRFQQILDLFNSFSGGVFLGTCFVHLMPQAEMTMDAAFSAGGLPLTYSSALTQLTSMLGFFAVLLVERCIESCRGSMSRRPAASSTNNHNLVDEHELTSVKGYIVTVSSSDSALSENDSDVELVRERDRMLRSKLPSSNHSATKQTFKKKSRQSVKSNGQGESSSSSRALATMSSAPAGPRCHSRLVAPAELDDLSLHCIILLLALCLHSLFEGVAIGLQDSVMALTSLAVGVTVHGCLIAFAFGVTLASRHRSVQSGIVRYGLVYSSMVPIGVGIGMVVGSVHGFVGRLVSALLQSLTAGTFVFIIFMEILPSEIDRNYNRLLKVLVMFVGFVIICSLRFVMVMVH